MIVRMIVLYVCAGENTTNSAKWRAHCQSHFPLRSPAQMHRKLSRNDAKIYGISSRSHPKSTEVVPESAPEGIPEARRLQVTKKDARAKTKFRFFGGKGRPKGPFSDPGKIANGSKIVLWSRNRHPGPPKMPSVLRIGKT